MATNGPANILRVIYTKITAKHTAVYLRPKLCPESQENTGQLNAPQTSSTSRPVLRQREERRKEGATGGTTNSKSTPPTISQA